MDPCSEGAYSRFEIINYKKKKKKKQRRPPPPVIDRERPMKKKKQQQVFLPPFSFSFCLLALLPSQPSDSLFPEIYWTMLVGLESRNILVRRMVVEMVGEEERREGKGK
jgi:hypothetical protein